MDNREFDCVVLGFSVGALSALWVGYELRKRVERWQARRDIKATRRASKSVPFGALTANVGVVSRAEQDARLLLKKTIPLDKRDPNTGRVRPRDQHANFQRIPIAKTPLPSSDNGYHVPTDNELASHWSNSEHPANLTAQAIRADALAALTGAGLKRAEAEAALDACSLAERAGGLESWVAAALRRAATK